MNDAIYNLSLKQLRAVQAVARYSSFLAAAVELHMSQPGVSRLVRGVEESLGVRLFHRSTRHVMPTQEGLIFLPTIHRILAEMDLSVAHLASMQSDQSGHVIMACPLAVANRMLSGIIKQFRQSHPRVTIEIREALRSAVIQQVRHGTVDFALGSFMEGNEDMLIEDLYDVHYHVVFHHRHRFARMTNVSLSELQGESMISLPPTSIVRSIFDAAAARKGFRLNHAVTVNTIGTIFDLVQSGQGIAIQSSLSVDSHLGPMIETRPLVEPCMSSKLSMMRHRDRTLTPAAQELKNCVEQGLKIGQFESRGTATDAGPGDL
ncbi:LysR family transcriptional regulator [Paracoccus onubensis]|uniref:LysR family transcriptional regulator n=1 Tax=Paracoccus onubensis TaxID=1675788 RepID=A0A418SU16_9RHOB|nr:LysR family transcriptional regulator [Paracoccus onubensis]RJE84476.1 LysR family transcriptional regulator [Paracoccus onubensis]